MPIHVSSAWQTSVRALFPAKPQERSTMSSAWAIVLPLANSSMPRRQYPVPGGATATISSPRSVNVRAIGSTSAGWNGPSGNVEMLVVRSFHADSQSQYQPHAFSIGIPVEYNMMPMTAQWAQKSHRAHKRLRTVMPTETRGDICRSAPLHSGADIGRFAAADRPINVGVTDPGSDNSGAASARGPSPSSAMWLSARSLVLP